jgi:hypothetical protein
VRVDPIRGRELFGFPPSDIGLPLVVLNNQFDRASVDASRRIDPAHGQFCADQRHAPTCRKTASKRQERADLVRPRLTERLAPRSRHEHRGADRPRGGAQT